MIIEILLVLSLSINIILLTIIPFQIKTTVEETLRRFFEGEE